MLVNLEILSQMYDASFRVSRKPYGCSLVITTLLNNVRPKNDCILSAVKLYVYLAVTEFVNDV